ncbi:acyl-CoA dehydrogenase [Temperatibacter marinus]|uniref:Acyl-CoA dehydrogenase n=1 Tax=Temperatibacter marinus TaxID=1456591 RepID=A0AA52EH25_9PROT|nr:acyl-CoA dehydrogenase [Temperatibacter marinus]WND03018.1 acyl-CoA dehydrogenase [Temperatibacter marinus]
MSHVIDRRELEFQLFNALDAEALCESERYNDHDLTLFKSILDTAEKIAIDHFEPHAAKADEEEPKYKDGKAIVIPEVKAALDKYIEAGFMTAGFDYEHGGMQLPALVTSAIAALFTSANTGTIGYPFLTIANANLLSVFGCDEQKQKYMEPMIDGRYFGTMCLSEPHAGSSLADIRTLAKPLKDGTYALTGTKMWISGGDHELSENIIHLVLAKTPGSPAGTKGISLFAVPKYLVNYDGSLGERNNVDLAGLNHKMGYRGTTNTLLNFGEKGDCIGTIVGQEGEGLKGMFHMMNEARIGVGIGAAAIGYAGFKIAREYAAERPQGRAPSNKDASTEQLNIIEHTDVKRMLLAQKAYTEGGLNLTFYGAWLVDKIATSKTEEKAYFDRLLGILTPIIKAWPSEFCLKANDLAIQCLGGYGYTRDYPVERLYRDNRLNPIHEGTNGIQSMDLLGRKVAGDQGKGLQILMGEMKKTIQTAHASKNEKLKIHATTLAEKMTLMGDVTTTLLTTATSPEYLFMNSHDYLIAMGHLVVAWRWLEQALVADRLLVEEKADVAYLKGKLQACTFFFTRELPHITVYATTLTAQDSTCLDTDPDWLL